MKTEPAIVLASTSAIRFSILTAAGVAFTVARPAADEAALKTRFLAQGVGVEGLALALAEAKARSVDAGGAYVLGADQIMELDGEIFDKPRSIAEAADRLVGCAGRAHRLINGVAIVRDGARVFAHTQIATLHMRAMSRAGIEAYLDEAGEGVLASVGAYQVEALGARLFERIDGDYFTVLGLSLFPLLGYLRGENLLSF
ncbi:MAG: Maf family protein [Parvularculaceae bacterium]